jgi:imidazolonepropionase-like amidohydrolase
MQLADPRKTGRTLAHHPRPHIVGSKVTRSQLVAALLLCSVACKPAGEGVVVLEGATLLNGSGGPAIRESLILIRDGHIQAVGRGDEIPVPRGAVRVSVAGKTIIPGLIDAHARVERWAAPRYLAWGVTTVRDLGAGGDSVFAVKNDLNLGTLTGPRMFTSGPMIDGAPPASPTATGVTTELEARRAVDLRGAAGADYVAIHGRITPPLMPTIMREAETLRMAVAAHPGMMDALSVARAGVRSIEQLAGVVQAAVPNPAPFYQAHARPFAGWAMEEGQWGLLDSATVASTARALAATRVALVPTLVQHEMWSHLNDVSLRTRPTMSDVPASAASVRDVARLLERTGWITEHFAAFRRARARQDQFVREFKRAGGLVAAGTDAASELLVPGAALHDELELLVAAGFTGGEAIIAATRKGAELLHADSLGQIAAGAVADLVVLNANPLDDIAATRDIAFVMSRGRIFYPDSLRRTWSR